MPFRDPEEIAVGPIGTLPQGPEPVEHAAGEVFGAAFRQEHSIASWWSHRLGLEAPLDPDFDPFAEVLGTRYEDYLDAFTLTNTPDEVNRVKARIDQELVDRQTLAESGSLGVIASLAAGVLDPINLVPVGGATLAGGSVLAAGARVAAAGFLGMSATEAALHASQTTRTYGESAINIAAGTLLAGVLGAGFGKLAVGQRMRLEKLVDLDMETKAMAHASVLDTDKVSITEEDIKPVVYVKPSGKAAAPLHARPAPGTPSVHAEADEFFAAFDREHPEPVPTGPVPEGLADGPRHVPVTIKAPVPRGPDRLKYPVIDMLKTAGGVRTGTTLAGELAAMDVTPKRFPGLFRKEGGIGAADTFVAEEHPVFRGRFEGTVPESAVLRAVREELFGKPMRSMAFEEELGLYQADLAFAEHARALALRPGEIEPDLGAMAMATVAPSAPAGPAAPPVYAGPLYEKLSASFGVAKLSSMLRLSPMLDIMIRAKSLEAKMTALRLAELPVELEKNVQGIGTAASVEARVIAYRAIEGKVSREADLQYRNYRRRVAGKALLPPDAIQDYRNRIANAGSVLGDRVFPRTTPRLSRSAFLEAAGRAATRGDFQAIGPAAPEVTALARYYRKQLFDPIKDELVAQGLLPQGVKVDTAISYLMRVYKVEALRRDQGDAFRQLAANWFMQTHSGGTVQEALQAADDIKQHILGTPGGRVPYESMEVGKSSPLKERVFTVADDELHRIGVLETNIELVGRMYLRTMSADIELQRTFGSTKFDGSDAFKAIVDEYQQLVNATPEGPARSALHRERDDLLRKIHAMWDMLRGMPIAGRMMPPDALSQRTGKSVRQITSLGMGGRFAINSMTDFGRIVLHQGMLRTLKTPLQAIVTDWSKVKLTLRELEHAGIGFETLLGTRAQSMADIGDEFRPTTAFERGLNAVTNNFFLLNGLSPLTTMQKQFAGLMIHQRILDAVEEIARGAGKASDVRDLASLGIGRSEAAAIAGQAGHWDRTQKLFTSNTLAWTDRQAVDSFRVALRRATDRMVTTPGVGDRPIPMVSTEMGKLIGQFRNFNFVAINSALIPMLQKARHGDAAAFSGLLSQVFLGMGVYWTISKLADKEPTQDLNVWIAEGIDRSGALGFFADINNMVEVLSRGTIGINAAFGGPVLSRYAGRNYIGALLGPQVSRMEDIAKLTGALSTGELSESDTRAVRRMLPYNTLFYLDSGFDAIEESVNEALGVPRRIRR